MQIDDLGKKPAGENQINWVTAIAMFLFHVGALAALFFFSWKAFLLGIFLYWVAGSLGIGMGYHRLLTHRGYKTPKWVEYFLTVCATLALEGGPIFWVATHRIHHQYSDKEGDPHSPIDGKWWAHMGWILMGKSMHHDTSTLSPLRSRPGQRQISCLDHQVPLRSDDCAGPDHSWRSVVSNTCSGEFSSAPC